MATIAKHRSVSAGFGNEVVFERFEYDFSKDAGATGALDIFTADGDLVITHAHAVVKTACTSAGSATVIWGITGDTDKFMDTTLGAVASLTADAVIVPPAVEGTPNVLALPVVITDGQKGIMTIGTADLTAGKIEFVIGYIKP